MRIKKLNEKLITFIEQDNSEDVCVTMIDADGNDREYITHYTLNGNILTNELIGNTETFDEPIDDDTLIEYILNNEHYPVISITRNDEEIFLDDEYMDTQENDFEDEFEDEEQS